MRKYIINTSMCALVGRIQYIRRVCFLICFIKFCRPISVEKRIIDRSLDDDDPNFITLTALKYITALYIQLRVHVVSFSVTADLAH